MMSDQDYRMENAALREELKKAYTEKTRLEGLISQAISLNNAAIKLLRAQP